MASPRPETRATRNSIAFIAAAPASKPLERLVSMRRNDTPATPASNTFQYIKVTKKLEAAVRCSLMESGDIPSRSAKTRGDQGIYCIWNSRHHMLDIILSSLQIDLQTNKSLLVESLDAFSTTLASHFSSWAVELMIQIAHTGQDKNGLAPRAGDGQHDLNLNNQELPRS
ncbi:hypothetical protein EJB05_26972, partial [Eragrostis curvula]